MKNDWLFPVLIMDNFNFCISAKNCFMKKSFILLVSLFLIGIVSGNSQTTKKETPPPPPPKVDIKKFVHPIVTVKGKMADDFYERNPSVTEILRQGNVVILKKKDGTSEKYDLSKKDQDKNFTEKYGVSPIPPPPPPKTKSKA